jgi:hypothetical protein
MKTYRVVDIQFNALLSSALVGVRLASHPGRLGDRKNAPDSDFRSLSSHNNIENKVNIHYPNEI